VARGITDALAERGKAAVEGFKGMAEQVKEKGLGAVPEIAKGMAPAP